MAPLRAAAFYYIRNALPFATGAVFTVLALRVDYAWYWIALVGVVLVVVGPLTIQFVLTLVVEALRGLPSEDGGARTTPTTRIGSSPFSRLGPRLGGPRIGSRER